MMRTSLFQTVTPKVEALCDLVRTEYEEMPGLCLSQPQMQRLWNLNATTCRQILRHLMSEGFLRQTGEARYRRAAGSAICC